jgi:hypothetical protein
MPKIRLDVPVEYRKQCECGRPKRLRAAVCWRCARAERERDDLIPVPELIDRMYLEEEMEAAKYQEALEVVKDAARLYQAGLGRYCNEEADAHAREIDKALEVLDGYSSTSTQ